MITRRTLHLRAAEVEARDHIDTCKAVRAMGVSSEEVSDDEIKTLRASLGSDAGAKEIVERARAPRTTPSRPT